MIKLSDIKQKIESNGKYWIAFVGDSITSCEWVHPNWREIVEYVLQDVMTGYLNGDWKKSEWGIRGFNFALDGSTTKDILERVNNVKLVKPDLVISIMGGNDPTLGVSVSESVDNIRKFVSRVETEVVWCNSIYSGTDKKNMQYEPYAKSFMQMPNIPNLQKIDLFNIYKQFDLKRIFTFISEENPIEGIKAGEVDQQHPNQLGNAYIAKVILKEVFDIDFDPEIYMEDTRNGEKLPRY